MKLTKKEAEKIVRKYKADPISVDYVHYFLSKGFLEGWQACRESEEVRGLVEAAKKVRESLKEYGHASDYEGLAVRCPDCDLCRLEIYLAPFETDSQEEKKK